MKQANQQKGFTIIEVVLVLAIAALIFLVVFLAVPALQRSQRDTQRRSDLGRFHTAIVNWAGNRQGKIPETAGGAAATNVVNENWVRKYVMADGKDKFEDPRGNMNGGSPRGNYNVSAGVGALSPPVFSPTDNTMYYRTQALCDADTGGATATGATVRTFAVLVPLESGDVACQDNR